MVKTVFGECWRYLIESLTLLVTFMVSLGGVNAVQATNPQSGLGKVVMAAGDPAAVPDILANFALTSCLAVGSLFGGWVYFAAKNVKDELFRKEADPFKRVCFLSVSVVMGLFLGLVGVYKVVPEINLTWVFISGGGGAMAAWGLFDTVILTLEKIGKAKMGGN
jgi:hypothetical protein